MSDVKQYKYVELTIYTPHNEYTHTVWREDAEREGHSLTEIANEWEDLWEELLGGKRHYVTFDFDHNQTVIMSSETVARCEVEIYLKEDNNGLPF